MKKLMLVLTMGLFSVAASAQGIATLANNEVKNGYLPGADKKTEKKVAQQPAGMMLAAAPVLIDTTGLHNEMQKVLDKAVVNMRISFRQLSDFKLEVFGETYSYNERVQKALENELKTSLDSLPLVYNLGQYASLAHHWNGGEMEFLNLYHVAVQQGDQVNYYEVTVGEYRGYGEHSVVTVQQMKGVSTAKGQIASHKQLLPYARYKESFEQETRGENGLLDITKVIVFDNYK